MDLEAWSTRLKVFADATRVRLLALLAREELTVAELSAITQLAQPRVSTHLAKLKEAGLVRDRRAGVSAYYRFDEDNLDTVQRELWRSLRDGSDDPLLRQDAERVAGVLAELLSPHAKRYICIDTSARVVAAAGERLRRFPNVEVREGDMHALPFKDASFDLVVLMHALTYSTKPAQAVAEAARVLRRGGRLLLSSLAKHEHRSVVEAYGHVNLGFSEKELRKFAEKAGLEIANAETVTRERRPPHFEVLSLTAVKP